MLSHRFGTTSSERVDKMNVLKSTTNSRYTTQLVELEKPVLGGDYAIIALCDGHEFARKEGYCLDAAIEVYPLAVKEMNTYLFNLNQGRINA